MIDKDNSGTLEKPEIVKAVKEDKVANAASYDRAPFNLRGLVICGTAVFVCLVCGGAGSSNDRFTLRSPPQKVIDFLKNCGEENLQFLLHPPRLDKALDALDTDKSGELDIEECTARCLRIREIRSFDRALTTQGKPPSTAASRSAWSSWPTSASAASAPQSGPTPNSR